MRRNGHRNGIAVTMYDAPKRDSISLTVYGADLLDLARHVEAAIVQRWTATKLNDRRHKRR